MKRISAYFLAVALMALCLSCTKEDSREPVSGGERIRFATSLISTRGATVFDGDDPLKNTEIGGGDFSVNAYVCETGICYFSDAWVKFFAGGTDKWQFRNDGGTPEDITDDAYVDYYWPKNNDLNFFAYMPYKQNMEKTYVTIGEHTLADGPSFSCDLPLNNLQDSMQEFIYAYATDQNPTTQGTDGVKLRFVHPFSSVVVILKESYRMTIKTIAFENIFGKGTYANRFSTVDFGGDSAANFTSGNWTTSGERSDLVLEINEPVPGENINFDTQIGGPYIVVPQSLSEVQFAITYERDDIGAETKRIAVASPSATSWEPGKRYTYNIKLGDPQEEILFNVRVDEWDVVDYKQEIDVQ